MASGSLNGADGARAGRGPAGDAATPDQTLLDDWLERWESLHEHGRDVSLEHFIQLYCQGSPPHLLAAFRAQAQALRSVDARLGQAGAANQPTDQGQPQDTSGGPAAAPGLQPGAQPAPGYRLERRLGRGGFGEVWRAAAPGGFPVALKLIPLDRPTAAAERRALELLKQVRHPHLLATVGLWEREGYLIVAMELADRTLADRLQEAAAQGLPGIPGEELLAYLAEAAQGLDYLNEPRPGAGAPAPPAVQHRDVKPHNLLLVGGSVKVGDFGLARHLEHSQASHSGGLTAAYAAPEFFQGRTSRQSDQYSLAVTYCELRGGRLPFSGDRAQIMHGHLHDEPDLSMLPDVDRPVVGRALAKQPQGRWPSCAAFVAALRQAQAEPPPRPPPGAVPVTAVRAVPPPPAAPPPAPAVTSGAVAGPGAARRRGKVLAALGGVALLGALGWWLSGRGPGAAGLPEGSLAEEDRAFQEADAAVRQNPNSAPAHVTRGSAYFRKGELLEALQDFNRAIHLDPGHAPALARRGIYYLARGDKEQALRDSEEAIRVAPQAGDGYAARARVRLAQGEADAALDDCNQALLRDPKLVPGYLARAEAAAAKDDLGQALRDCDAALRLSPRSADAYWQRGTVHAQQGEWDEAVKDWGKAVQLAPRRADWYASLGRAYLRLGGEDQAIHNLTMALVLRTLPRKEEHAVRLDLSRAFNASGVRHARSGNPGRAIYDWEQALLQNPKSALTHFNLGVIHAEQGDTQRALQHFDQALALNTLDPAQQEDARRRRDALRGANPPPP
jgi:tetratricopeptide (TPR) repeat protein